MGLKNNAPDLAAFGKRDRGASKAARYVADERFECVLDFVRCVGGALDNFARTDFGASFTLQLDRIRLRGLHQPIRCGVVYDSKIDLRLVEGALLHRLPPNTHLFS